MGLEGVLGKTVFFLGCIEMVYFGFLESGLVDWWFLGSNGERRLYFWGFLAFLGTGADEEGERER